MAPTPLTQGWGGAGGRAVLRRDDIPQSAPGLRPLQSSEAQCFALMAR